MKKVCVICSLYVVMAMVGFEVLIAPSHWWAHGLILLVSLFLGCGLIGSMGEPDEEPFEPDPNP